MVFTELDVKTPGHRMYNREERENIYFSFIKLPI